MNDKFMTYAEAIKFLKLSRTTIDRYIARKAIPNYKVGRLRLFDRDELIEWVKGHRNDKPKKKGGAKPSARRKK
jgi:excisionase family DNA binding protein